MKYKDIENRVCFYMSKDQGNFHGFAGAWRNKILTIGYKIPGREQLCTTYISREEIDVHEMGDGTLFIGRKQDRVK